MFGSVTLFGGRTTSRVLGMQFGWRWRGGKIPGAGLGLRGVWGGDGDGVVEEGRE